VIAERHSSQIRPTLPFFTPLPGREVDLRPGWCPGAGRAGCGVRHSGLRCRHKQGL